MTIPVEVMDKFVASGVKRSARNSDATEQFETFVRINKLYDTERLPRQDPADKVSK